MAVVWSMLMRGNRVVNWNNKQVFNMNLYNSLARISELMGVKDFVIIRK